MTTKVDSKTREEGHDLLLDFNKLRKVAQAREPVVPVAVQDADSKEVLIVAYANETALKYTLEQGVAAFWSTSRDELWVKGATSGDTLELVEVRVNCEQNSLLVRVATTVASRVGGWSSFRSVLCINLVTDDRRRSYIGNVFGGQRSGRKILGNLSRNSK